MVRMLLLMAGITAVLADPTPPVDVQPAAEAPADKDVVARATRSRCRPTASRARRCARSTMRRGQDAAAAAVCLVVSSSSETPVSSFMWSDISGKVMVY